MTHPLARLPGRLRLTAAALAGACLIAPYSPSQETTAVTPIIPFPTETRTLPNGLKVIVVPMPSDGLVAYWSIVRTGSRDEFEPGVTGFAHFFEHMMFRGTESYPADVYDRIVTTMGADANAFTTDDLTAYHLVDGGRGSRAGHRDRERPLPEPHVRRERVQDRGRRRLRRVPQEPHGPRFALYEELVGTAFERHRTSTRRSASSATSR